MSHMFVFSDVRISNNCHLFLIWCHMFALSLKVNVICFICLLYVILLSNLLTYESHIKSYVLEKMSYMSYVLYVLS